MTHWIHTYAIQSEFDDGRRDGVTIYNTVTDREPATDLIAHLSSHVEAEARTKSEGVMHAVLLSSFPVPGDVDIAELEDLLSDVQVESYVGDVK